MPTDKVITAHELSKSFPSRRGVIEAVRSVSIEVERGEIFGFLGPNGAGKTTILRMLTTLLPIDSGKATVAGFDVAKEPRRVRSRIGYVSQLGGADELATGRENLILQARLYGQRRAQAMRRVNELVKQLDLDGFTDRRVKTYSGGQRRRLDVALGVVHEPAVLFLDEPTTGLDPQSRAGLWACARDLRDRGTTVFLTTHYLEEADVLCDRLMIIDHGQVVALGTPRELKRQVLGDSIAISLRRDSEDAERALPLLRQQPYVRDLAADARSVRLYVDDADTVVPLLVRLLDQADIGVRSITLSEPSLDDVFLRKTGRSLGDAEGVMASPANGGPSTNGKASG